MKKTLLFSFISFCLITTLHAQVNSSKQHTNPRFEQLKNSLFEQPYKALPSYKVKRKLFGPSGKSEKNKVLAASRRTFSNTQDLIEQINGQKLLNANGICFSGSWEITKETPYTGLYKKGSISPAIIRASVALSGTLQKNKRAFGMAIKLLPNDIGEQPSLNAFVLHSMGGTITKNVLGLSMDNQPPLGSLPKFSDLSTALRLRRDLERADSEVSTEKPNAGFRPVISFAAYNELSEQVIAPKWLRLSPITQQRIDLKDFRDELRIENYDERQLKYNIEVAGQVSSLYKDKKNAKWQNIGTLTLLDSVTSPTCDLNLHFQHPQNNKNK